jgi:ABC-type uncharacterized transport system substrate-binding protein
VVIPLARLARVAGAGPILPQAPMKNAGIRCLLLVTLFAGIIGTQPACAHPHVFAEARLELVIGPDHTVQALRHVWRFDEVFSSTVLLQFDTNKDLKLENSELEAVAKTIHDSLADYNYFQLVTQNGKNIPMQAPPKLMANFKDGQLIVFFETHPKAPLKLVKGDTDFGIYDPTFYTAIDFLKDDDMQVDNLPSNCTKRVIRPDPDTAIAQNRATLTASFFADPTNLSKIFATKLQLECKD